MRYQSTRFKDSKSLGIKIMLFLGLIFAITFSGGLQASAQTPNFGPNVTIITPSMSEAQIETALTNIANDPGNFSTTYISNPTQSQFSTTRNAILFLPGAYTVKAPVGYYESIAGLGATPGAVTITGYLSPQFGAWTTQNSGNGPGASLGIYFWRSMENLTIDPLQNTQQNGGVNTLLWGVSQAAPMRRVQVNGALELTNAYCGSASGGYISNTVVTGAVNPCSQQQWYTRNSSLGSWSGGVWNMVFSGVQGAPAPNYPTTNRYTVLPTTPVSREKPFLYVDGSGNFNVFVPAALTNSSGTTWAGASGTATSTGNEPGYTLPISSFFIAQPSNSLSDINTALANGQNLILTPGIYQYNGSINITNPNTIVLGLGYATIVPQAGTAAITIADVEGVQIAGLLIDAGPVSSPVLMQIGVQGASRVSHASNPITINDVFFRIGGAEVGTAATSMEIDSDNVILDNIWAWRADHGAGASPIWTGNAGENGVIVNGDNVTALGLFVEHYEGAQVLWNGNGGETIFYQSELPYDVPSQSAWMDGSANGYPSYVVSNSVTSHAAYGLGVYSYFDQGLPIIEDSAITVPYTPGVDVIDAVSVFLTGSGQITATVDNVGTVAESGSTTSYVPFYGVACSTTCPAAPTNLDAFAIAPTQVNLTWTASSTPGAVYTVFRSTSAGFTPSTGNQVATSVTGTSFADTTAVAGTPYYYVVEASDVAGLSSASNQATATTTVNHGEQITSYIVSIDSGCLNAAACTSAAYNTIPTTSGQNWVYDTSAYLSGTDSLSVKAVAISNPTGTVNWVPNNVFNSYTHGGPFTYTIPGLTPGASYIVALDFNENFVQTGTGFTNGGKVGYREFNVAINGAAVLNNFDIYATTGGANVANVQSFYTFADATGKISILFTIGAANNPTVNGIQVGTGSNMPPALVAPTSLAASSASDTQANISWDASSTSGVVYEVFRSTISGFTPSASNLITTTSGTSYVDASLLPLTTYYYLVEASDGLFNSVPSNQASVSTPVGAAASIAEIAGSGQTAQYGAEFTNPLTVIVQDAFGNLVPSASVTFAGTGVNFPSGNTAVTNTLGQAQVTAQPSAVGALSVTASVSGASVPTSYTETGTAVPQFISFTAPTTPVTFGVGPITLVASGGGSGQPVIFSIDPSSNATGSINGSVLTITSSGTQLIIDANQAANSYYTASTQVQQTIQVNQANPTLTWAMPAAISYGTALSGTQLNATATGVTGASLPGTFTYTPLSGTVLTPGTQTLSVSFTPTDTTDYTTPATATVQLQVNQASPTITWATPAAITYGTALSGTQLNATATGVTGASLPGIFTYTPLSGTVLTAGSQTLSVSFTPTDTTNYTTPLTTTVQLQVTKANPTLAWVTPSAITYGTALSATQLNASLSVSGTCLYTPAASTVLAAGQQTLSVTCTPTDTANYTTATATVQLQVNKANPTLAWATPVAISYGTALSGTQLNAVATGVTGASLPGVFTYSPLSGTVLATGSQTLSVSFVPTDTTDYTTPATATVQLQVNKASPAIALVSSLNPILLQNPVTYTATVSSTAGKPTGTVTFQDGGVALAACTGVTVTTATGVASCTVTYTVVGTHSITAVYNGDTNFLAAGPSNTVSEAAIDINLGNPTTTSETILPGGTATYSFPIAPGSGTSFPLPVTFTVTGLPTGATATLTPSAWALTSSNPWTWTLPANTALTGNTLLSIQVPQTIAALQPVGGTGGNLASRLAPFSLALLLLPFVGRLRRTSKRLGRILPILLLLIASMAAMAGLSGCGGNSGLFAQAQRSYPMTVTVSSGSLSHTSNITLIVE